MNSENNTNNLFDWLYVLFSLAPFSSVYALSRKKKHVFWDRVLYNLPIPPTKNLFEKSQILYG